VGVNLSGDMEKLLLDYNCFVPEDSWTELTKLYTETIRNLNHPNRKFRYFPTGLRSLKDLCEVSHPPRPLPLESLAGRTGEFHYRTALAIHLQRN
jgi:hypothetical protein